MIYRLPTISIMLSFEQIFRSDVGQSWSKRYRKTYGTMKQFLNSHKNVFHVNGETVSINELTKLSNCDANATIDAIYEQSERGACDKDVIADLASLSLNSSNDDAVRESTNNFINDATSPNEHGECG